jgi:hypothetical protein
METYMAISGGNPATTTLRFEFSADLNEIVVDKKLLSSVFHCKFVIVCQMPETVLMLSL